MKRMAVMLIGLFVLALPVVTSANYATYLNGDCNFILCDGHMGTAWYVDSSSLVVQRYEPPQYVIAVNVVTARSAVGDEDDFYSGGRGVMTDVRTMCFAYNWDDRAMYVKDGDGWHFLLPTGSWAETGIVMPAGEIAFYLAYHMKFYGSKPFYNAFLKRDVAVYNDEFYVRIP